MSVLDTARRVIDWAGDPDAVRLPPPTGSIAGVDRLANPPDPLCRALGRLAGRTAAQLRLPAAPCGDSGPIGTGGLVIAAAIGVAQIPQLPRLLLGAVPSAKTPREWVVRHGLVAPALPFLPPGLADDCLALSPLTALLHHPGEGGEGEASRVAQQIIDYRPGKPTPERSCLVRHFACPNADLAARRWRTDLLDRLRLGDQARQSFVLDVYEALMIHHRRAALEQVRWAHRVLTDAVASANQDLLNEALASAQWWGPLAALERSAGERSNGERSNGERSDRDALRARRYLGYAYREGVALFRLSRKLSGGRR